MRRATWIFWIYAIVAAVTIVVAVRSWVATGWGWPVAGVVLTPIFYLLWGRVFDPVLQMARVRSGALRVTMSSSFRELSVGRRTPLRTTVVRYRSNSPVETGTLCRGIPSNMPTPASS